MLDYETDEQIPLDVLCPIWRIDKFPIAIYSEAYLKGRCVIIVDSTAKYGLFWAFTQEIVQKNEYFDDD